MNTPKNASANTGANTPKNTSASEKKTFRSRISVLLTLFMLAALTPAVISAVRMGFGQPAIYIIGAVTIAITLFFTGMHYTVADGRLSFRMWSIRGWSVEIADIRSVWRSYNPLSSPAASLKRLHIQFRKGVRFQYILISPARERQFLDDLKAVNPEIVVNVPEKRTAWRIWDWDI